MNDWRSILGFTLDEDLSFGEVHDRYRQLLLAYTSPLSADDLRRLSDALDSARAELGTSRISTGREPRR